MDNELGLLRAVVRAYLAERRAWEEFRTYMHARIEQREQAGQPPTDEDPKTGSSLNEVCRDRKADLDGTLARLREVNPGLFDLPT